MCECRLLAIRCYLAVRMSSYDWVPRRREGRFTGTWDELVGAVFLCVVALFPAFAIGRENVERMQAWRADFANAQVVDATVVDNEVSRSRGVLYRPVLEYPLPDHSVSRFTALLWQKWPWPIGHIIQVRRSVRDPRNATAQPWSDLERLARVEGLLAVGISGFLLSAVVKLYLLPYLRARKARQSDGLS